ncbi:MAG: BMP family protein [Minwuia sp.]|uniref:BMP family protein n=1 Tax=Minwuia sp. TaxID=2493630 RepID=UPI003A8A576E
MLDLRRVLKRTGSAIAAGILALTATSALAADNYRVGVLIPGSAADSGFMESGMQGVEAIRARYGDKVTVQLIENINYADMEQVITALASQNDFVAAVSGASQNAMAKVAKRFPGKKFALVAGATLGPDAPANMSQYDVGQAQIAFLSGAAMAMMSKTGKINYVGGLEIPGIVNSGKELERGARHVKPETEVIQTFTGSFDDVAKAKEATLAAVAQGADMHYHILNLGLKGMEQAARETSTVIVGGITARCGEDPIYTAYSITGVGHLLELAVTRYIEGTWEPGSHVFGLAAGPEASGFKICGDVDPAITQKLDEIKQQLIDGTITTARG